MTALILGLALGSSPADRTALALFLALALLASVIAAALTRNDDLVETATAGRLVAMFARRPGDVPDLQSHERFGSHIAGVIQAATSAADAIRREAEEAAEAARQDAKATKRKADAYAQRVRAAADADARRRRSEVDARMREVLAQAESVQESLAQLAESFVGVVSSLHALVDADGNTAVEEERDLVAQLETAAAGRGVEPHVL